MSARGSFLISLFSLVILLNSALTAGAKAMGGDQNFSCHVVTAHEPSAAEKAYLSGDAKQAEALYREALGKSPHDPAAVAGLVRSLVREQKVDDASSMINAELTLAPDSVPLLVASAEVLFREGRVMDSAKTADKAFHADPCNPRLYLFRARLFRLNSMYASERRAIGTAHVLDPSDADVHGAWLRTLPLTQQIDEQKKLLATPIGLDPEERSQLEKTLPKIEDWASHPDKTCHLVSTVNSTELPLALIMAGGSSNPAAGVMNGSSFRSTWGLHVSLNETQAVLGVDTGASGLLVNRAIAERAGLTSKARIQIGGVGDQGPQGGFVAPVDSIRVGSLEFRDCMVSVTDRKDVMNGMDGLIGTDVFRNYIITLDYPMRKFLLSQLPPRPSDAENTVASLDTAGRDSLSAGSAEQQDRYVSPTMRDYFPIFRSGHFLIVPVILNNKIERLFILDTGAFSTAISPDAARLVTKVHGVDVSSAVRGLSGGVDKLSFSEAVNFRFAGIQQQNNDLFSWDMSGMSRATGLEISGFLGSTLLRQLTISIDYRDGLAKFDYDSNHGNHNF
jgi:predicted aspartyl protease